MEAAQAVWLAWLVVCGACSRGAMGAAGSPVVAGFAPGLNRRFEALDDDFFSDHKDLLSPPKDLLETPKDLTDTPKDLVDTPEDLVETPKDLLDDHQSDNFEEYAKYGSAGRPRADDDVEGDGEGQHSAELAVSPDADTDTAKHDEEADLALAKHLQESDVHTGGRQPGKQSGGQPSGQAHLPAPVKTPYNRQSGTTSHHGFRPISPPRTASFEQDAPVKTRYHASRLRAPEHSNYGGHLEHDHERFIRPEYAYRYGVHDPNTKDVKSAWEQRDGENTRGGYALLEPDGHTRVVEYSVTRHGGFNAQVKHLPPSY